MLTEILHLLLVRNLADSCSQNISAIPSNEYSCSLEFLKEIGLGCFMIVCVYVIDFGDRSYIDVLDIKTMRQC